MGSLERALEQMSIFNCMLIVVKLSKKKKKKHLLKYILESLIQTNKEMCTCMYKIKKLTEFPSVKFI